MTGKDRAADLGGVDAFWAPLERGSAELYADHPDRMSSGAMLPTVNQIHPDDVSLFYAGIEADLVTVCRGARFNTLDRPTSGGHWGLVSRSRDGGWYNAEYLPQIAAYVDAVINLGYPSGRVLFELPGTALQLDLAILDDTGRVVVLGEAKRDVGMLDTLRTRMEELYTEATPDMTTTKDEARQLGWRVWTVAPDYTWLIAPHRRAAYLTRTHPLTLTTTKDGRLPTAVELGLDHEPPLPPGTNVMPPPRILPPAE